MAFLSERKKIKRHSKSFFLLFHRPKTGGRFIVFVAKPPINVLNVFMFPKLEFSLFDNIEILFCSVPNFYIRIFFCYTIKSIYINYISVITHRIFASDVSIFKGFIPWAEIGNIFLGSGDDFSSKSSTMGRPCASPLF